MVVTKRQHEYNVEAVGWRATASGWKVGERFVPPKNYWLVLCLPVTVVQGPGVTNSRFRMVLILLSLFDQIFWLITHIYVMAQLDFPRDTLNSSDIS